MKVLVIQSCLILCNSLDCSPSDFSVHGILRTRTLECIVIPFSRVSYRHRDQTSLSYVSCIGIQLLSHVWHFVTPWTAARQASLSITNSQGSLKLMSIESVMPSNHLILCHLLLLPRSIFPSIRFFSNESGILIRWPKYWNFSFSISPSNEYLRLISFRMDWLDVLAVQGTLKSLL